MRALVTLDWWELEIAATVGLRRQTQALKDGKSHRYDYSPDVQGEWWTHELACQSELAVAKGLGVYWPASIDAPKSAPDVGYNIQVRTLAGPRARLVIRDNDPEHHLYVAVLPHDRRRGIFAQTFEIAGWVHGDARHLGERAAPHGRPPANFFTTDLLHPIHSIPVMNRYELTFEADAEKAPAPKETEAVFG